MRKFLSIACFVLLIVSIPVFAKTTSEQDMYDQDGFLINQPFVKFYSNNVGVGSTTSTSTTNFNSTNSLLEINPKDIKEGELASCFDYYKFGSVNVNLSSGFSSYSAGDPVMITGVIKNNNTYPVVGLDIKARLIKNIPNPNKMRSEIITLDDFDVVDNITLDKNGKFNVSYSYILPLNAPAGQYQVLFYAVEQDRFNLAGLYFTNDIITSKIDFEVIGKQPDHVYLDQTQITVGGQPHNVMAFMTKHVSDIKIPISIPLNNPENKDKEMLVTYDLYSWDSTNPANKINTKTETVTVPAKSEIKLTYNIDKGVLPVYYLSITAEPTDKLKDISVFKEKTISNIRFVVEGLSKPRINYIGIDTYPLKKGVQSTLVTCFHNTNNIMDTNNTKIETVLYDQDNKELSKTVFDGKTVSNITGLIHRFTPLNDITQFAVISKIFDAKGNILDTIEKKYDCKDINPDTCLKSKPAQFFNLKIVSMIIVLCMIALFFYKRKLFNILNKNKNK